ncbi:hypothetical protein, conserved [Eimeria brunetti]|uniref:Protein kinase domain-containing protein n=1 Tax=Eimeria brunetti TaxID=51314 RepID=U6LJG7_9EIME|nr:hypothetical protein, conserved [Eimeria brunetti]
MDGHLEAGGTHTGVKSEPAQAAKHLLVDSRKTASGFPPRRVSQVLWTLAAASLVVFAVVGRSVALRVAPVDPRDTVDTVGTVDTEGGAVSRVTYIPSFFSLFGERVKRPSEKVRTGGQRARDAGKAHTESLEKMKLSVLSASVPSGSHPVERAAQFDDWGLSSLEHFERTLPSKLQQGKAALAAWVAEFYASDAAPQSVESPHRVVCEALWGKSVDSFVGMVLVLRGARPLKAEDQVRHLPHVVQVKKVAAALQWGLLLHVEDVDTHQEHSLQIPMLSEDVPTIFGPEQFLKKAGEAFTNEQKTETQACGNMAADQVGSLKGFAVTLYTAEIAGVAPVCFAKGAYVLNRPKLMEKVQGNFADLKIRAPGLMVEARDYIASRLLQIVLKIEQTGIGHLALDWGSLFLRGDGSFLLGNFGSSAPFGRPIISELTSVSDQLDPGILLAAGDIGLAPAPGGNLWSLGILLFQLYTGKGNPYGTAKGDSPRDAATKLAKGLLSREVRSYVLANELAALNVPSRWQQLILRLLEPRTANRITGFEITREFPDLVRSPSQ